MKITEKDITDMYVHLRTTNQSIPDEVLEFMKIACQDKLAIYSIQDSVSLEVSATSLELKLYVRENFRNKKNKGAVLSLTPRDLLNINRVGSKLFHFGKVVEGLSHDNI